MIAMAGFYHASRWTLAGAPATRLLQSSTRCRPHGAITWCRSVSTRTVQRRTLTGEPLTTPTQGLRLSDSCVKRLQQIATEETMLRVTVEGGGCSGFQYKFTLDDAVNSDDKVFERDHARVVIDSLSLSFLEGAMVDYHHELIRSSFRMTDIPKAELGCSCGVSFAVKDM